MLTSPDYIDGGPDSQVEPINL